MIKKILFISITSLSIAVTGSALADSYSDIELGVDHIDYQEHLAEFAGQGKITQSASANNPTLRNFSYSELNDQWGLIVQGSTTLATSIQQEKWSLGRFGQIQEDEFKIKYSEIGLGFAYALQPKIQLVLGGKFTSSGFTRSNFQKTNPGAAQFEAAIAPAAFDLSLGAVTEDQYSFLANVALRYDTRLEPTQSPWSWYAEIGANTPIYNAIQNTNLPDETLTDSFNGWGVSGDVGVGYRLLKTLSLKLGVHGQYSQRDAIVRQSGVYRLSVPDITLTSMGVGLGISWTY